MFQCPSLQVSWFQWWVSVATHPSGYEYLWSSIPLNFGVQFGLTTPIFWQFKQIIYFLFILLFLTVRAGMVFLRCLYIWDEARNPNTLLFSSVRCLSFLQGQGFMNTKARKCRVKEDKTKLRKDLWWIHFSRFSEVQLVDKFIPLAFNLNTNLVGSPGVFFHNFVDTTCQRAELRLWKIPQ